MEKRTLAQGSLKRKSVAFFRRFHTIIYFIIMAVGFAAAITYLESVMRTPETTTGTTPSQPTEVINQQTIQRIENYRKSSEVTSLPAISSPQRNNPFSE